MANMKTLNEEQRKAIQHGDGPLLIIAGAGTGKTTVITERIKHLIVEKKIQPNNILALTFTEKAAREMEERVDISIPYGYTQMWISTFHAFCDRILRAEAIHIGLTPGYTLTTEAESVMFLRKNLFQLNLEYFRPLGNPNKFLEGLLQHFSRLKDEDITPEQYLDFAKKRNAKSLTEIEKEEIKKTLELANAYKTYEELKIKEGSMDFSDLIANTLNLFRTRKNILNEYQKQFQYILIDEFQDTNFAQNELALLLAGEKKNITAVGDDDQCLPGDTLITTAQGLKKIQDLQKGNNILTAVGKGHIGKSTITRVIKNMKYTTFITITTENGDTITATNNHKMFCYVPKKMVDRKIYYVYLMYRKTLGWRLGITNDLAQRLKLERSSDAIVGLRTFPTEEEARYHELLWSLSYKLPTCIFKARKGVMMQKQYVKRLYHALDTEKSAGQLAQDLGINLDRYHYVLDAVTRGQSRRCKINLYLCFRKYTAKGNTILTSPSILHLVHVESSDPAIIKKLKLANVMYTKAKKGIRIRKAFTDIEEAGAFTQRLAVITGGFIEAKASIGKLHKQSLPALIMPAGNLLEGHYIPVVKNNTVVYDKIVKITREKKKDIVYDLEIERTHNFIANGIIVHNSIYRFRGSSLSNMLQFRDHFPNATVVTLNKNYRSTAQILDRAYQLIQHNNPDRLEVKEKIDKKLKPMRITQGSPVDTILTDRVENEAEESAKKIQELHSSKKKYSYKDFAILVRANDHAQPFLRTFERYRIPYQFLGPGQLFHQEEIKDLIAYLKVLYNFEDSASLYRVLTMQIFGLSATEIAILLNAAKKKNRTLFETLSQTDEIALSETTKQKLQDFVTMIKRHLEKIPKETAGQILYYFLQDSHLLQQYLEAKTQRDEIKAQNVAKFFERLKSYEAEQKDASVFAVVDWIDLSMQMGESPLAANTDWSENDAVNILTVHSSKGLEFPVVFLVNLVTQRFPSRERREQIPLPDEVIKEILPEGDFHLQEERRLFYVGITRAKDRLFLTAANFYGEGKRERKYSPFLIEAMGTETIEKAIEKKHAEKQQLSLLDLFPKENDSPDFKVQTPIPNPITYISYSQLQTFEICPLHYKLRYILKIPTAPNASLTFGTSMHAALKDFYQKKFRKETVEITDIEQILRTNWINEGYVSKFHEQKSFAEGVTILTDYLKKHFDPDNLPIATELPFQFFVKNDTGQLLKVGGRIDRIDRVDEKTIEILDYKTGKNLPDQKELAKNFQLSLYGLAVTEIHDPRYHRNAEEIKLSLYYLEEGKKLTTTRSKEQLEEAKKEILRRVDTISKSEFLCSGNSLCLNCEYKMLCKTI